MSVRNIAAHHMPFVTLLHYQHGLTYEQLVFAVGIVTAA